MQLRAVDHSVNIISYQKDGRKYAMCCAWVMMVDYDKLLCLLGSQSETAKHIKSNDIIGVSSLSTNQKDIAIKLGEGHSNLVDKLDGIDYKLDGNAITILNSKTELICEVIDVLHLKEIESDSLLYLRIIKHKENEKASFLHMEDF
ncbi:TPA: flavin reductase [Candidatus Avacholeplasma faecigallinarum]|nr:flavin reductase [Candidatus Avacholeplasma faecigallinarum]